MWEVGITCGRFGREAAKSKPTKKAGSTPGPLYKNPQFGFVGIFF
jgi:hypothetical protein